MSRAIAQVKDDQTLVLDANLLRYSFEEANSILIQTNGDLLGQFRS
jgi:hypothetical protein